MDARQLADEWAKRAGRVEPEVRALVKRVGDRMLATSLQHLGQQIYDIPEDVSAATGRKKWTRTGRLRHNEKLDYSPDGSAVTLTNSTPYARARHELGRGPSGRQTKRPAHWRDGVVAQIKDATRREMQLVMERIRRKA